MQTIFETCVPRVDVLEGTLTESMFAARLSDVVNDVAADVYQNPAIFFASTYPTDGMRSLFEEACGRLTGRMAGASAIRLDTSFGGGKTHQLIGLYHIATRGRAIPGIERFADPSVLPASPVRVAAVVGSDLDPVNGIQHDDGVRTYTLWGEIAYRLGAYDLMAESDRQRVAPGTQALAAVIGEAPTLVIIDEIATYLARLLARGQAEQSQLSAFLFSLLELGTVRPHLSVVYTLAASSDAFGHLTDDLRQTFEQQQSELASISARQEHIITATLDQEVAGIVTSRLFESVDRAAAGEVAAAYADLYRRNIEGGEPLPSLAGSGDYRQALERSYPLHPEMLNVLINKVGTLANFHKTRGALRLLALAVRDLWSARAEDAYLMHLHHINLGNDDIAAELTSRLDRPGMRGPIQADIISSTGSAAHAQELDAGPIASGKPPIHRDAATSVFLHSLVVGTTAGATINDVTLASSGPTIQPSMLVTALEGLEAVAWHLDRTATGQYRFRTEPSLNKVVADRKGDISTSAVKQEIRQRLQEVYGAGQQFRLVPSPSVPAEIDDTMANVALAVIDFDSATVDGANKPAPALVQRLWERAGTDESFRRYVNRVFFLLAERGQLDRLFDRTREMLAVEQATQDPDLLNSLETIQRQRLDERKGASKLEFRVALCNTYRHLYYPGEGGLRQVTLPPQDTAGARRVQQQVLYDTLRGLRQIQEANQPLSPAWVRDKAWPGAQDNVSVKALYEQFYAKAGLPLLQTPTVLIDCIIEGLKTDAWRAKQGETIISRQRGNIPTTVDLSGDMVLYDVAALDESLPVAPPAPGTTQVRETPTAYVTGGVASTGSGTTAVVTPIPVSTITGMGDINRAFAELRDECERERISAIKRLDLEVEGKDAVRALGLALPGLPRRGVTIQQTVRAYIGDSDYLTVEYSLPLDKTNSLRSALRAFDENVDTASMTVQVSFDPAVAPTDSSISTIQAALSAHAIVITLRAERAG